MSSSPYTPVVGTFNVLETSSYRQYKRPLAQREIKAGDALWQNNYTSSNLIDSWVEPALNSPSGYNGLVTATSASTPATYASTSSTAAAEQTAFAAAFAGISMWHVTPRSFVKYMNFAVPASSSIQYDSTAPYLTVVTSGIAEVPYYDGTNTSIPTGYSYPVGYGVTLTAFLNASTFFVDASGIPVTATKYYLYNNSVQMTNSGALMIGKLVKNAVAGDSILRIEFSSYLSVSTTSSGAPTQTAGVLIN